MMRCIVEKTVQAIIRKYNKNIIFYKNVYTFFTSYTSL